MGMSVSVRKQVLMQLNEDLVSELDELVAKTGRNRSDLAREALNDLLRKFRAADIDRRYIEGYTRYPQTEDEWDEDEFNEQMRELDEWDGGW